MNLASRFRLNVTIALSLLALAIPSASAASSGFIRINEFMANNAHYTNADGSATDWVELYNISSTTSVNLRTCGYSLTDSNSVPYRYIFNWDVIIPPNGIYLITCDSTKPASAVNAPFGLGKNGGYVSLYTNIPGVGAYQVDTVQYGLQPVDYSLGRVPDGTGSFALCTPTMGANNQSLALGSQGVLKLNEWMADDGNGPDWFEIYNPTNKPVPLAGLKFYTVKGLSYLLPALSFIGCTYASAYQQMICDKTTSQDPYLANHLDISLSKSSETLIMEYSTGQVIDNRAFTNSEQHVSEGRCPDGSTNIIRFYGVGDNLGPTPGALNTILLTNPIVNEVLIHTDPPLEDAVEFQNRGTTNIDISGWWISNDRSRPNKAIIPPGPAIPPGGFRVIYQYMFNTNLDQTSQYPSGYAYRTNILECFTFNSAHGDSVHLFEVNPSTGLPTGNEVSEIFESAANGWSFGHYDTTVPGDYKFVTMSSRTFGHDNPLSIPDFRLGTGLTNAYPLVGPVVINEVMYMPYTNLWNSTNLTWVDDPNMEYIELRNLTGTNVPLFYHDLSRLDFNTNSWRLQTAVDYTFASNTWMGPYSFCLVVGFDPKTNTMALTNFCKRYGVTNYNVTTNISSTNYVRIVGPWSGRLNNTGDAIELYRPDEPQQLPHPDAGYVPYLRVDKVNYLSHSEWTTDASGNSNSLQRLNSALFGNDPINWVANRPSAGQPNPLGDNDGDGMPNDWEILYGFNPNDPTDADQDADHDGMTNLQEYLAGTNPRDANSKLSISILYTGTNAAARLTFPAVSNHNYQVQSASKMEDSPNWNTFTNVVFALTNRSVTVYDTNKSTATDRYFRVRVR